ncbi:Myc-type, basic helix-loop-helix (bHLH) domain-containing protein [Artemisia annua]|uniref:Myc-type, basic helix-loop-helix (BHLH) domain-containing protein n=1 Tax=Artemisia annua TaxID=35608 RepID=A0A2U1M1U5_ARTAN|nr:Myc-type, basic helix-loop-helix (bHLH) domain-containing protein [Artemisia annua]
MLEDYSTILEQVDAKVHEEHQVVVSDNQIPNVFNIGEKNSKSKNVQGQPSKNLMAERRRRKRLNDRLSMLRSIVPRISKMDRTSILGDTIEYMKDLMEKIRSLKEQDTGLDSSGLNELKVNQTQERNSPKFEVERRNIDTRIQICCAPKPGLLFSTVNTIESLGLDIRQCVISSFGDFTLHASCYEAPENQVLASSEEIKQILFKNAGYGGRGL